MTEFKFELERSSYFKNRSDLLKANGTPKLSDAKVNLGETVANVVFKQCEEALREDFGLKVPLKGPGDIMWVSPSDLLIGKIALKPPFTPKCLQALTHKGILEIGQGLEDRFRQEMELDKQQALEKYKTELLANIEERMKSEIKDVEIRERFACQAKMERQQQEFDMLLKEELDKLEMRIRVQYEEIIANHETSLKAKWENKLQQEVKKTVEAMTKNYLAQLDEQEERLIQMFQLELKKQELLRDSDAKLYKRKTMLALRQLKHNLECTNLVNMMYVLCTERRKCCDQKTKIEKSYKEEIRKLEEQIKGKDQLLAKVTAEKEKQIVEVTIRETCLREVIKHFQKFINFALRAAPTQAEFLLSVEKMMVFELTNEITKSEFPRGKAASLIIPWKQEKMPKLASPLMSNLNIQDHHDCLHELNPPINENAEELGENDILPAMYFKNKTYIREDFRNMLSSGVQLSPSCELWNKDVEILVTHWREQMSEKPEKTQTFEEDSIDGPVEDLQNLDDEMHADRRRSNKSTVQFSDNNGLSQNQRVSLDSRRFLCKSSLKPSPFLLMKDINFERITDTGKSGSIILAAKDSLEILLEKKQKSGISLPYSDFPDYQREDAIKEEPTEKQYDDEIDLPRLPERGSRMSKELVVETKDSVIMRMTEMATKQLSGEFDASPKDSVQLVKQMLDDKAEYELKSKSSKLATARNSIEMLRESLHRLRIPSQFCQKKDSKKQERKEDRGQQAAFAGTCCDKCKRESTLESASSDPTRNGLFSKADSLGGSDERAVRISCIQIINLDEHVPSPSVVSFNTEPVIYKDDTLKKKTSKTVAKGKSAASSKKISRKSSHRRKRLQYECKISGEKESFEGDQLNDEFTAERIHSLIKLMRNQPHLIDLFTAGSR